MADVDKILAPGGAGEYFLKAREQGKVRFLGASAHKRRSGHRADGPLPA
jgi:predicted aldo/keto reductase-like oxidoreductase